MYSKCQRLSNLSLNSISSIEKWVNTTCTCHHCQETIHNLENSIENTTIIKKRLEKCMGDMNQES